MSDTEGQVIVCKAAVCWDVHQLPTMETIEVDPPGPREVRVKVISNGLCRSDLVVINGLRPSGFPIILGHEASAIVESVGKDVTYVKKGDHVIPSLNSQCLNCKSCKSDKKARCLNNGQLYGNLMYDGTSRITCKGKKCFVFRGIGTFAEYAVIHEISLTKIRKDAPLEKVCLLGCGVATGYGAAINDAKVEKGSSCAVWGLGAIGLSTIMGCKKMGAKRIIAIDTNPDKEAIALKVGATEFINPLSLKKPIGEVLVEITDGGLDYAFECIGLMKTLTDALDSVNPANGSLVVVGVTDVNQKFQIDPKDIFLGKSIIGTFIGGWKIRTGIPKLVDEFLEGSLNLDDLISMNAPLEDVNKIIDLLTKGKIIRGIVQIGKP